MIQLNCTQRLAINILKQGHIPEHISFIMDGNRRYALSKNKESFKGHQQGKQSLKLYLLYCLQLGVKQASFYCFSIQNFKRSQKEVNKLMQLVMNTFDEVSEVSQFVLKKNVQVRIIGKIQLFRKDVADCLKNVQERTKNNTAMIVNLCFAYDSIDEINTSVQKKQQFGQSKGSVDYAQIYQNLSIIRPVDIMVRTSNESRLSNFMLMQNGYSLICILKQNWPEVNLFSLTKILFHYNFHYKSIQKNKKIWLNKFNTIKSHSDRQGLQRQDQTNCEKDKLL